MAHRETLVLEAIRRHMRDYGTAPTLAEIGARVNLPASRIGRFLHRLAEQRKIVWKPRSPRSIVLMNRLEMISDSALAAEVRRRALDGLDV